MAHNDIVLGAALVAVPLLVWIGVSVARAAFQLRKATLYLQQLCWRADQDHGESPQEWRDPAGFI